MNIKIASEKTGLTKKAIKYYESEGLIHPSKNVENNYREYADADIVKLNLIGSLRVLDIPIVEIREVVESRKSIPKVMKDALDKINESIENLHKSKLIITNIIEINSEDYDTIGKEVKKLKETLELSLDGKKEYVSSALLRIFPGDFGKLMVSNYEPFLKVAIDTDEKKKAWLQLVEFLDDLDEVDENHPFLEKMKGCTKGGESDFQNNRDEMIRKILSNDLEYRENLKKEFIQMMKYIEENEEIQKTMRENVNESEEMLNSIGCPNNGFDEYLFILNEDYKRYNDIMKEINKEVEEEAGLNWSNFFKGL